MALNGGDLVKRVCAGFVYVLITGGLVVLSPFSTMAVMALTAGMCCFEFIRMVNAQGHHAYMKTGVAAAALIPVAVFLAPQGISPIACGLGVACIGCVAWLVFFVRIQEHSITDVALTLFGCLYTGLTLSTLVLLRDAVPTLMGGVMCLLLLASVWFNDAFAYLGGSLFGKHKFSPRVSPKKTWEGVICGLVGSCLFWCLIPTFVPDCGFGYVWAVVSGLLCGMVCILGDLTESRIKRCMNTKDSGTILPGHGGMLDRSDSLLFVSCMAYVMVTIAPLVSQATGVLL